jgi:hypothetical protein
VVAAPVVAAVAAPAPAPEEVAATPPPDRPVAVPVAAASPPPPAPAAPPKVKIAIIGPLPDQFKHIKSRVNGQASLIFVEKEKHGQPLPDADWYITTHHTKHIWDERVKSLAGRDRLIHLNTGGIKSVVFAVSEAVEAKCAELKGLPVLHRPNGGPRPTFGPAAP